jgi:hypothetical protein
MHHTDVGTTPMYASHRRMSHKKSVVDMFGQAATYQHLKSIDNTPARQHNATKALQHTSSAAQHNSLATHQPNK